MNPEFPIAHPLSDASLPDDVALSVRGLSKKFCRNLRRSMWYGMKDVGRSLLGIRPNGSGARSDAVSSNSPLTDTDGSLRAPLRRDEFWALDNLNFELRRGETLGVVGRNGSGKSTLLRILNGIFQPDHGEVRIRGRVGGLIALGAGMHPHMTGRENVHLNGAILGMTRGEIRRKFDEIIDFAELGSFIDAPVSTYSSGMHVRLGFAIAIHGHIDVLVVDEVLAVGDVGFMFKCFNKLGELRRRGVTSILVTHDLHNLTTFSTRVLVLNAGRQEFIGDTGEGLSIYKKHFADLFAVEGEIQKVTSGSEDFDVCDISFEPPLAGGKIEMKCQGDLSYTVHYYARRDFPDVDLDTVLYLPIPGPHFFQANNYAYKKRIDIPRGHGRLTGRIKRLSLNNMGAKLSISLWENDKKSKLLWWEGIPVYVSGNGRSTGWSHFDIDYEQKSEPSGVPRS